MDYFEAIEICRALESIPYGGVCDDMYNYMWDALLGGRLYTQSTTAWWGLTTYDGEPEDWDALIGVAIRTGWMGAELEDTLRHEFAHAYLDKPDYVNGVYGVDGTAAHWAANNCL
jgi:hypothetical protein